MIHERFYDRPTPSRSNYFIIIIRLLMGCLLFKHSFAISYPVVFSAFFEALLRFCDVLVHTYTHTPLHAFDT